MLKSAKLASHNYKAQLKYQNFPELYFQKAFKEYTKVSEKCPFPLKGDEKLKTDKDEKYIIVSFETEIKHLLVEKHFDLSAVFKCNTYAICKHSMTKAVET